MTAFLHAAITLAFAVSVLWVLYVLLDEGCNWAFRMGDMLRIRAATASRLSPCGSSGQPHIAIVGEAK